MELEVVIHRDEESDCLWASVLQLPGCYATGDTHDELMEALTEAINMYLEDIDRDELQKDIKVERYRFDEGRTGLVPA